MVRREVEWDHPYFSNIPFGLEYHAQHNHARKCLIPSACRSNLPTLLLSKHIISRPLRPLHPRRRPRHFPLQPFQPLNALPPRPLNLLLALTSPNL
jgi:hypothetical protein